MPGGEADEHRRAEAARRERLLEGRWARDLAVRLAERFGQNRRNVMGRPSTAHNVALSVVGQAARLYDQAPEVSNDAAQEESSADFLSALEGCGAWELGRRLQRGVMLVRQGVRCIEVVGPPDNRVLRADVVPTSQVYFKANAEDPDEPVQFVRAVPRLVRSVKQNEPCWTWDLWDIEDPANPQRRVVVARPMKVGESVEQLLAEEQGLRDVTAEVLGVDSNDALSGSGYRERYADDSPFLPSELFHYERSGLLWTPWEGCETVEATYAIAILWTFWQHVVHDASWPQRYVLNAILKGAGAVSEGDPAEGSAAQLETDPSLLLQFLSRGNLPAQFGQWQAGGDPSALQMAIQEYQDALLAGLGFKGTDARASQGRSGYAIELDRAAVREQQARMRPGFARADSSFVGKAAALANREGLFGGSLPEEDWRIVYPGLPLSREERDAAAQRIKTMQDAGIQPSRVWAVQQAVGVPRDTALSMIRQWEQDEQELAADGDEDPNAALRAEVAALREAMTANPNGR